MGANGLDPLAESDLKLCACGVLDFLFLDCHDSTIVFARRALLARCGQDAEAWCTAPRREGNLRTYRVLYLNACPYAHRSRRAPPPSQLELQAAPCATCLQVDSSLGAPFQHNAF